MKHYERKFTEGTLVVSEELRDLYNDSMELEKFSEGLLESLTAFLTMGEIQDMLDYMQSQLYERDVF